MIRTLVQDIRVREESDITRFWQDSFNINAIAGLLAYGSQGAWGRAMRFNFRAYCLPLNRALGENVYKTCTQTAAKLGLARDAIEFYVSNDPDFNSYSFASDTADGPSCIVINRGLLERITPGELAFIVGHEIGHLEYGHVQLQQALDFVYPESDERPLVFQNMYSFWENVREVSADRVGLLACGDIETSVRALFRLSSGLEDRLFNPDITTMTEMVDRALAQLAGQPDYSRTTHPANPIRVKALLAFARSRLWKSISRSGKSVTDRNLDSEVSKLLGVMRHEPADEQERTELVFLAAAGLRLIAADRQDCQEEYVHLYNVLSEYVDWPPSFIAELTKVNVKSELIRAAKAIVREYPHRSMDLLRRLAPIVVRDRRIDDREVGMFLNLGCNMLRLPETEVVAVLLDAVRRDYRPLS